jgi:Na+/melibiose symporter-like transporter
MVPLILAHFVLAIIAGIFGSNRNLGFWGFFIISLVVTPILVLFFLLLTKDKSQKRAA